MMMARAVSFVPKEFPVPSFSLAFTDSSQEETLTQEERSTSEKGKSQVSPILVEDLEELVEQVANTGVAAALNFVEDRSPPLQKFEKFETPARMTEIVTTMCLILNKTRIKRFEEQVYCFPPDIVNMALGNHGGGEFLHSKTKKPFDIQDYSMFIPYLDMRKLASHSYAPIKLKHRSVRPNFRYLPRFDCAIYVMKWLEVLELENIKKEKYDWENWTQILFHEMNQDRDRAIREIEGIRLSKPSAALLSPYCQLGSNDIDND
ncbi:hypothetical protein Ahy_B01g056663 [Arachis hypogaea]|uniref:Ubiquitin-like protease family profile domain-containing protein n=1 Tax=Arachis hypogaea TaxID=3818 RepID=A0A445AZB3_ARAHY|nr:hypothetical protein Ahy_B01g056663 [Arachis hypogaea]